jgi:hypothetical protein
MVGSRSKLAPVAILAGALALGAGPMPGGAELGVVDRILDAIQRGRLPPNDIALLEHTAEGRFAESDVAVVLSLGIGRRDFSPVAMRSEQVRAHAYRKIGEIRLPEAQRYLAGLTVADIGTEVSQQVWPAAQIALHMALLGNLADREAQLAFLRKAAVERGTRYADGAVQNWAQNELCNSGDQASLPLIRDALKRMWVGTSGEREEIRKCEVRMEVLSRSSDRVRALASVLQLGAEPPDEWLINWAITQLDTLRSPDGDREIARFGAEIERLPQASAVKRSLSVTGLHIHDVLASRSR